MSDASRGARNHKAEAQASYKAEVKAAKGRSVVDRPWYLSSWWAIGFLVVIVLAVAMLVRG